MRLKRSTTWVAAVVLAGLGASWFASQNKAAVPAQTQDSGVRRPPAKDAAQLAYESRSKGKTIAVRGVVERILSDDRDGSPHQRFILRTPGGLSLLVAHNLDLAPRLNGLAPGEAVLVLGEYEWNEKGGVMHWTHDDPQGRPQAGYIEWRGRRYQ